MTILDEIIAHKKQEVKERLYQQTSFELNPSSKDQRKPLGFRKALQADGLSIIAEVKKASPSKGLIREDFDPKTIARQYAEFGANCISVLTDEKYFQGHADYFTTVRKAVPTTPLIRKDFMIDERQIRESYDMGADAVLLIVAALNKQELLHLSGLAKAFGMDCLVEVHTETELDTALSCDFDLIGINNRNLKTFETNLGHSAALKERFPDHVVAVSESGIRNEDDCLFLREKGFDAILVGETLMRQPHPGEAIHQLLGSTR
jgi:indole-3-glycerol phosphate synthase